MKKLLRTFILLAITATPFTYASADPETYTFDQDHTQILFFINHLGFSNSQGEFEKVDGTFTVDETAPQNSMIDISIPVNSLDMDSKAWEDHVLGEDFLNAEEYPNMTFKSTAIDVTGEKAADVTGDLTLHGVTKPVTLHVTHNKTGTHPKSKKTVAGFSAHATLNRSDYGITYGLPGVGDEVEIRLEVEGIRDNAGQSNDNDPLNQ